MRFKAMVVVAGVLALAACKGSEGGAEQAEAAPKLGAVLAQDYPQAFEKWQGYVDRVDVKGHDWIKTLDVTSGTLVPVKVGEADYLKGFACQSGEATCEDNRVVFFVSPDQTRVLGYGQIVTPEGHSIERMIGAANGEELRCLRFYMTDATGAVTC